MTLALDTNVVIELVRGRREMVRERLHAALIADEQLVASIVVWHELRLGCELSRDPAAELARVERVLSRIRIEPLDEADFLAAASVRAALLRQGRPIGPLDGLIAGQALRRGWTVVTANVREFDRIGGLKVIDWTQGAD